MKISDIQRIHHIHKYCEKISRTIQRLNSDYENFKRDDDLFQSISMSIFQIGELSVSLTDEYKAETRNHIQWGAIRSMRNMFAHGYGAMDLPTIWDTAINDIPALQRFCEEEINQAENEKIPYETPAEPKEHEMGDRLDTAVDDEIEM